MHSLDQLLFSVIIPTRERPALFGVALKSVIQQRFQGFEVIVVIDGPSEEHARTYREILATAAAPVRMFTLFHRELGHGPSYVRNYGAAQARGKYLCFLDDDDEWTEPEYLTQAAAIISASVFPVDLILANQRAFAQGVPVPGVTWIEDLQDRLRTEPDSACAYTVKLTQLLQCQAHCHLNTTITSLDFFLGLGGLDEGLRYEEDRDFYLRAIDHARIIKFLPWIVSRHNIPDIGNKENTSTGISTLAKRLYQLRLFDKAVLFSTHPELRRYAMRQRAYTLKHIAIEAARMGCSECASYYARQAFIAKPTPAWLAASGLLTLRRLWESRGTRAADRRRTPPLDDTKLMREPGQ